MPFLTIFLLCLAACLNQAAASTAERRPHGVAHACDDRLRSFQIDQTFVKAPSLQGAIEQARPGALIVVPDCTFFETLSIRKPLVLRAARPGGATLTGASEIAPTFERVIQTKGMYRARMECAVRWAMYRDRSLIDYKDIGSLTSFTYPRGSRVKGDNVPGLGEGFANSNGSLYVRLLDDLDPNDGSVLLQPARCDASDGMFISASDVIVEGFNITNFPGSGILIHGSAKNVSVRNNRFTGVKTGISVWTSAIDRNITIEHNEYSATPTYQHRQLGGARAWGALYDSNLATRFVFGVANGLTIRGNYIYEAFDGIEVKGGSEGAAPEKMTEVKENVIQNIVDNALEFDAASRIAWIRAHHNLVIDAYAYVSLAPFQAGRVTIDHNIFYTSPESGLGRTDWLKLKLFPGTSTINPMTNIKLVHNTVVLGDNAFQRSHLYQTDPGLRYKNSVISNNALLFSHTTSPYSLGASSEPEYRFRLDSNLVWGTHIDPSVYPTPPMQADPLLRSKETVTFTPPAGSPLIDNGEWNAGYFQDIVVGKPDMGAIEAGAPMSASWPLSALKPGPSWMPTGSPLRPPIPPTISRSWAGQ